MNTNPQALRAIFFMEQHLGHRSFYQNLRKFIDPMPELEAAWEEITYAPKLQFPFRLPGKLDGLNRQFACIAQVNWGMAKQRSDITVYNTQVPAVLNWLTIQSKPYVLCTDITPIQYDQMGVYYHHPADKDDLAGRLKYQINRRVFQRAACVIPWSNWTKASLIDDYGVEARKIAVIPPGVNIETWKPRSGGSERPRQPVRILFVGGDFVRKGGDLLLEAFRQLPEGSAELIFVTRDAVQEEKGVSIIRNAQPNSPDLIALYQSCDIFAFPTRAEAFGISAVEASAVGLPVIATHIGGLSDIVADGETGFVVPPDDLPMLLDRLKLLIADQELRDKLGSEGRKRVEERFDAQKNAVQFGNIVISMGKKRDRSS
jgi:glycosyltransferase involved in cell wall biosynthesis